MNGVIKTLGFIAAIIVVGVALGNYFGGKDSVGPSVQSGGQAVIVNGYQEITVTLDNGQYQPNPIVLQKGVPARLIMDMDSLVGCARAVRIPQLNIQKVVKDGDNVIAFTPQQEGMFKMTCAMGMYGGKITVV